MKGYSFNIKNRKSRYFVTSKKNIPEDAYMIRPSNKSEKDFYKRQAYTNMYQLNKK